jgi:hypothetical protein
LQKGQTREKGFALIENDITTFELALKLVIYCRVPDIQSSDNKKAEPFADPAF